MTYKACYLKKANESPCGKLEFDDNWYKTPKSLVFKGAEFAQLTIFIIKIKTKISDLRGFEPNLPKNDTIKQSSQSSLP